MNKTWLSLLVAMGLALLVAGCDVASGTDAKEHIQRAETFRTDGDLRAASIELKSALQKEPENVRARWLLGELLLDMGDAPGAEKELSRARNLGVDDDSVMPLLSRAWLEQGKYEEILELKIAPQFSEASAAEVLAAQGEALLLLERLDQADAVLNRALEMNPNSFRALTSKALLQTKRRELFSARELLKDVFRIMPSHAAAWALLGDLEAIDGDWVEAEVAYGKAVANRSNNTPYLLKRALVRIQLQRFPDALADVERLDRQAPKTVAGPYLRGLLHFTQKRFAESQASFQQALAIDDNHLPSLYYGGITEYQLGNMEQADSFLARYLAFRPGHATARNMLAIVKMNMSKWEEAEGLVRPVVGAIDDDLLARNILAGALLAQGEHGEAIRILEEIASAQPDSARAKVLLGEALISGGQPGLAAGHLETALSLDDRSVEQVGVMLVRAHIANNDFGKATAAAQNYLAANPDLPAAHNLLGEVHLLAGREKDAEQQFLATLELSPGDVAANHKLAALAEQRSDVAGAERYYERVLSHNEHHLETLLRSARLSIREGDEHTMRRRLGEAANAHPQEPAPKLLWARYHLAKGDAEKAMSALGELEPALRNLPAVLAVTGEAQLALGQSGNAAVTLRRLADVAPDSAQSRFLLAKAYASTREWENVLHELTLALGLEPEHFPARLALTRLQLARGDERAAQENLAVLKTQSPESHDVLFLEAELARSSGDQQEALELYENLFEVRATTTTTLALAQQQWLTGDRETSVATLRTWVDQNPRDAQARVALADLYREIGQTSAVVDQYRAVLETDGTNIVALNNLAWHLRDTDPVAALEYAELAVAQAPESAAIMDTMALVLMDNRQLDRALRMSDRALQKSPDNSVFKYHKALILEAAGDVDQARELLSAALENDVPFADRAEAQAMMDRLTKYSN